MCDWWELRINQCEKTEIESKNEAEERNVFQGKALNAKANTETTRKMKNSKGNDVQKVCFKSVIEQYCRWQGIGNDRTESWMNKAFWIFFLPKNIKSDCLQIQRHHEHSISYHQAIGYENQYCWEKELGIRWFEELPQVHPQPWELC